MGVRAKADWITGEEYGRLRWELIQRGVPDDDPEFVALRHRVRERDEALWDRYGRAYMDSHPGKWIAIAADGRVIIRDTASKTIWAAGEEFGDGNFAMRKLADFPGHRFHG
jgi:hypothetical protein